MEAQNFIIDEEKALEVLEDGTSMDLLNTKVYAEALAKSIECIPENKCKQSLRAVLRMLIKIYTFAPNFKFGTK